MDKGSYTGRRVDFTKFAASFFNPYLFAGFRRSNLGCGASALALLTGVAPEVIAAKNGSAHYSDRFMVRSLRIHGFSVLRLTLCNVSAAQSNLGREHVILLSQLIRKNEGTWGVVFGGAYYHNFDIYTLETLSFLNKPVLSAYLLIHRMWRPNEMEKDKSPAKGIARREKAIPLSALGISGNATDSFS